MKEIKINSEFIRLGQFLKWAGIVGNGAEAGSLIKAHKVRVNGNICVQRGKKVFINDTIEVEGNDNYTIINENT